MYASTYILFLIIGLVTAFCLTYGRIAVIRFSTSRRIILGSVIVFLLLVVIATIRDSSVGKDALSYVTLYKASPTNILELGEVNLYIKNEPLFAFYMYICALVSKNYSFFFFITACIQAYAIVRFFESFFINWTYWFLISLIVINYVYSFSGIRFGISMSLCMLSFCELKKKQYKKAAILTIISILIHNASIVNLFFIVIVWFLSKKGEIRQKHYVIILCFASLMLSSIVIPFFVSALASGLGIKRYMLYLNQKGSIFGHIPTIFMIIMVFIFHKKNNDDEENRSEINIERMGAYFTAFLLPMAVMFDLSRILMFYLPLRICTYASTLMRVEKIIKPCRLLRASAFFITLAWMAFRLFRSGVLSGVIPFIIKG